METVAAAGVRLPREILPPPTPGGERARREVDPALALDLFATMVLIRRFEEVVQPLYNAGEIYGTTHLCNGEEAVSVGLCSMLETARDRVAVTYRGHGHAIALGSSAQGLMDELLGRASGTGGGRAGSMNVIDFEHGLVGCFGIVGGSIAAATGAGLALKGSGAVAVACFGDGAANQGYFGECLNFAAVHELPVLFVCENNLFGEFTPWEQVTAGSIVSRPATLGIPAEQVNGNDLWEMRAAAGAAVEALREGGSPRFIEAFTYRFGGHSRSDPGAYRPEGELEAWLEYDPLELERQHLIDELGVEAEVVEGLVSEAEAEVAAIVERSRAAPWPEPGGGPSEFAP